MIYDTNCRYIAGKMIQIIIHGSVVLFYLEVLTF